MAQCLSWICGPASSWPQRGPWLFMKLLSLSDYRNFQRSHYTIGSFEGSEGCPGQLRGGGSVWPNASLAAEKGSTGSLRQADERTHREDSQGIVCCIPLGKAPKNKSLLQPPAATELVWTQVHRCGVAILCDTRSSCDHRASEDTAQPFNLHPSILQSQALGTTFLRLQGDYGSSSCPGRPACDFINCAQLTSSHRGTLDFGPLIHITQQDLICYSFCYATYITTTHPGL